MFSTLFVTAYYTQLRMDTGRWAKSVGVFNVVCYGLLHSVKNGHREVGEVFGCLQHCLL